MKKKLELEIDAHGQVHPLAPATELPHGRALLIWKTNQDEELLLFSASALQDWLRPEEDEAWAYLQRDK